MYLKQQHKTLLWRNSVSGLKDCNMGWRSNDKIEQATMAQLLQEVYFPHLNNKQLSKKGNTLRGWCSQRRDGTENHVILNQCKRCTEAMKTWGVKTEHWQVSSPELSQPWSNASLFSMKSMLFIWALQLENRITHFTKRALSLK